jgi:23S rRNA (cytosine1962-C5)-methyltransferase
MATPTLTLTKNSKTHPKVLDGHPWVFAGQVEALLPSQFDGQAAFLRDSRGHMLGTGVYNGKSQIVWRRFSNTEQPLSESFLDQAIQTSVSLRKGDHYCRLVWSEADSLPGLVVDRFGTTLVLQILTKGMDNRIDLISSILKKLLQPSGIILRNDAPSRELEGLTRYMKTIGGNSTQPSWHTIDGIAYWLDLMESQKTGFYLDQRFEHARIEQYSKGKIVLDACCNQGGFALHAAKAGAKSVLAIDISETCINLVQKNAKQNGLNVVAQKANIFDYFTNKRDVRFDLIVLDPPPFAKTKKDAQSALRGYKELNLRALKVLNPGGILMTYACSHVISAELFYETLRKAAADARLSVKVLEQTTQPADHPILLTMPESKYLKGLILQLI